MISRLFHQYSWNSVVETTWKSLIGWRHRTSSNYVFPTIRFLKIVFWDFLLYIIFLFIIFCAISNQLIHVKYVGLLNSFPTKRFWMTNKFVKKKELWAQFMNSNVWLMKKLIYDEIFHLSPILHRNSCLGP